MTTEYDQPHKLHVPENLIDPFPFPGLFEEASFWGSGPGEDLQGIMDTRMGPPAVPMDPSSDSIRDISAFNSKSSVSLFGPQLQNPVPDSGDSRNHASILPPWSPGQGLSPRNTGVPIPSYAVKSFYNNPDAWTPLQVTGVPGNPSFMGSRGAYKQQPAHNSDRRLSYYQHGPYTDPEVKPRAGSSSDSGYGTKTLTTGSVISYSCPMDPVSTPRQVNAPLQSGQAIDATVPLNFEQRQELPPAGSHREPLPRTFPEEIRCSYPGCQWKGKCPSDKRKHEARHKKMHKCDEPSCSRKEGFGTVNDLERHKKCIHNKEPERGPKILYMCFAPNCPRRNKQWPRLDNFRQHLTRMHRDEDPVQLLKKSEEWYHRWKESQEASKWLVEPAPLSDLSSNKHQGLSALISLDEEPKTCSNGAYRAPCTTVVAPGETMMTEDLLGPSESLTLSPIKDMRPFDKRSDQESQSEIAQKDSQQSPAEKRQVALPGLKSLNLPLNKDGKNLQSMSSNMNRGRHHDIVAEAALNVVDAMTRLMDSGQRRQSDQEALRAKAASAEKAATLQDRKKEMLQKILSAALEHLGGPDTGADGGICKSPSSIPSAATDTEKSLQCKVCGKTTRLPCELKKHMKRHSRPYGCTFPKCYKEFGSKADWKRHENSQHFHLQSWRCTLPDIGDQTLECARLFYRQETYVQHLTSLHSIKDEEIKPLLLKNRLGRNGQSQFWCGFCRKIIPLEQQGLEAWNERFNHIDIEHFKSGERIGSWVSPTGRLTKDQEKEAEKQEKVRNREETYEISENDSSSSSSGSNSDPDDIPEESSSHPTTRTTDGASDDTYSHNEGEATVTQRTNNSSETPHSQVEQTHNHNHRKRKSASVADANASSSSTVPRVPRQGPSTHAAKLKKLRTERQEAASSLFFTKYSRSEQPDTDIRICCQCHQGPCVYEVNDRCVTCSHVFCSACQSLSYEEQSRGVNSSV
ncbi:hypothetical protein DTO207G8_6521 [Paecilomyces variotii]|nr:hypothetical protein DTO207G8_6521 [Paecilomyces variotii]